jgi:hypothetical protein
VLLPIVLFGALLADLDRPFTKADLDRFIRAHKHQMCLTDLRHLAWGQVLAAHVRCGMTEHEVRQIMGGAVVVRKFECRRAPGGPAIVWWHTYYPLMIRICYGPGPLVNGRRQDIATVVCRPTLADYADLFVPDWLRDFPDCR